MKAVEQEIDGVRFLVQLLDEPVQVVHAGEVLRTTQLTGIDDKLSEVYATAKIMLAAMANDVGSELRKLDTENCPAHVELEFRIGMSATAGPVWILSGSGAYTLKVRMRWELGQVHTQGPADDASN